MKRFLVFLVFCFVTFCGCQQKYFYNTNYPSNLQQQYYNRDHGYCTQMSYGSVPPQQVQVNDSYSGTTTGTFDGYGPDGYYQGRYNAYTTGGGGFASGLANGMNIGSALQAGEARSDIYKGCMAGLGWFETPEKTYTPPAQPAQPKTAPQLSQEPDPSPEVKETIGYLASQGFSRPLWIKANKSYALYNSNSTKSDGQIIHCTMACVFGSDRALSCNGKTFPAAAYEIYYFAVDSKNKIYKLERFQSYNRQGEELCSTVHTEPNMPSWKIEPGSLIAKYLSNML